MEEGKVQKNTQSHLDRDLLKDFGDMGNPALYDALINKKREHI